MIKAMFAVNDGDFSPVCDFRSNPFWQNGYMFGSKTVIVSYAADKDEILKKWPSAIFLEIENVNCYEFDDRFPSPPWFKDHNEGSLILDSDSR